MPTRCVSCGSTSDETDITLLTSGLLLCDDCSRTCFVCETQFADSENWSTANEGQIWCENCYSDSVTCQRCEGTYIESYSLTRVFGDGWDESWCDGCVDDGASSCDNCSEYYGNDSEYDVCWNCRANDTGIIHQYGFNKQGNRGATFQFHGIEVNRNKLFMGFELEMELNHITGTTYREAVGLVKKLEKDNICYLKDDSSINGKGFELVTHPHTLEAYQVANDLWNYIELLRTDYHARSWDTDSCGLHVHVSRLAFDSGAHTHRFISLIYKNPREMMKLAGRKTEFASFSDVWKPDEWGVPQFNVTHKLHSSEWSERHSAVNTTNPNTLELRFFRGNMKREGIMCALELCHASVEYTRVMSVSDVKLGMLSWEWFTAWVDDNNGIYPNLYLRMDKVPSVILTSRPTLNA